jgi:hypothetical protein
MNLSRKQTEMDRLIEHISEAEEEKKGKSYVGYAQPRHIKRLRGQDEHDMGAKRRQ